MQATNEVRRMTLRLATKAICNDWVKSKYKVLSSLLRLVTVDKYVFKSRLLQIARRSAPFLNED